MVAASETWWKRRCGDRLGRYMLGPAIGAGGAASVYMARLDGPHGFERLLAIKVVHEHLLQDRGFVDTFRDEANLAVVLSHPNIVHTYELGCEGAQIFIAMEYLRGKPLSLVYERAFARGAPLEYQLVAWLGARCAEALHYAHELRGDDDRPLKIVHRDISPDNIVITYDGDVKVIDFGIARAEKRIGTTALGTVKGKRRYMAPEYALGGGFDHTLDLFALGASLYEVALGRPAFGSEDDLVTLERLFWGDIVDPLQVRPDFPPALAATLRRAMSAEREHRHASGSVMAQELDGVAALSSSEARSRLSTKMRVLFADEIAKEASVIGTMRSSRTIKTELEASMPQEMLSAAPPVRSSVARTTPERPSGRPRLLLWSMVAGGLLALPFVLSRGVGGGRLSSWGAAAPSAAPLSAPVLAGSRSSASEVVPTGPGDHCRCGGRSGYGIRASLPGRAGADLERAELPNRAERVAGNVAHRGRRLSSVALRDRPESGPLHRGDARAAWPDRFRARRRS